MNNKGCSQVVPTLVSPNVIHFILNPFQLYTVNMGALARRGCAPREYNRQEKSFPYKSMTYKFFCIHVCIQVYTCMYTVEGRDIA